MKTFILSLLILSSVIGRCADMFIAAPNHVEFPVGGNSVFWPFTFSDDGITSRRFQQVYDADNFASLGPQGGFIKQLSFREEPMSPGRVASDFLDNVQITLSITPASADSLSPVFSENVGMDPAVVYGPAPLHVATLTGWQIILFAQPFLYVPSSGNLLIDIRTIDTTPYPFALRTLDAEDTLGDSISSVFANDVSATTGFLRTRGLVTGFLVEPIPEPGTWVLLIVGLLGIFQLSRARK